MNEHPVRLGPLALLLTVISILMTTLSVLVFTTARSDKALAEAYGDTVKKRFALEEEGEIILDKALQNGMSSIDAIDGCETLGNGNRRFTLYGEDGFLLSVEVDGSLRVHEWSLYRDWEESPGSVHLWDGETGGMK